MAYMKQMHRGFCDSFVICDYFFFPPLLALFGVLLRSVSSVLSPFYSFPCI